MQQSPVTDPRALGADCVNCPLGRGGAPGRAVPTEWFGEGSPAVAIVGEAPGRREVQMGRPFVGPSGKILDFACQQGGVRRGDLAILNACSCGPLPSSNEPMKLAAVAACRPRLLAELAVLQPRVVLAVGNYAMQALADDGAAGVTALRGALLTLTEDYDVARPGRQNGRSTILHMVGGAASGAIDERSIQDSEAASAVRERNVPTGEMVHDITSDIDRPLLLSTFHPAHILRGGDGEQDGPGGDSGPAVDLLFYFFLYDLVKAWRLAERKASLWSEDLHLFIEVSSRMRVALADLVEDAMRNKHYSIDVETDSIDAMRAN